MKELKNKFYRETEFLIGDPFKNHSRDAIWTWIEDKLSRPVEVGVIPAPVIKGRKRFCPECGDQLKKETESFCGTETTYWRCFNLVDPEHRDLPLTECLYRYEVRV